MVTRVREGRGTGLRGRAGCTAVQCEGTFVAIASPEKVPIVTTAVGTAVVVMSNGVPDAVLVIEVMSAHSR